MQLFGAMDFCCIALLLVLPVAHAANSQHYSFTVGDIKGTVLSDGYFEGNASDVLHDAVDPNLREAALSQNFLPQKVISFYYNPLYLDFGDRKVMIDVGSSDKFGPTTGKLMENMLAAGLDPLEVTDVLITHAHVDHIAGLLLPDGSPAFPNTKVYLSRIEYDFWMNASEEDFPADLQPELLELLLGVAKMTLEAVKDKLILFELGDEVVPGITSRGAGGHTPGQVNYVIR